MTLTNEAVDRLRRLKLRLGARPVARQALVPLVEVLEFSLTHGFREVFTRARHRLGFRSDTPLTGHAGALTIPAPRLTSIVIPVFNNEDFTRRCLESIVAHTPAGTYEVIVVDNGSALPTVRMLSGIEGLRLLANKRNRGFVDACNQGARAARGDLLLFLNNDTVVQPKWLEVLRHTAERDHSVGAVGAKLVYPDGRLQEAGGIIWRDGLGWNYGRNGDPEAPEFNYYREVDYCSGACLLVRRSLFDQLGGFDTRYSPAYYEDTDLCFRLRELGYRVVYQPAARITHFEGATAGTDTSTGMKRYQLVNHRKFVQRHEAALAAQYPNDSRLLPSARDRRGGKRILVVDHMVPHYDEDSGSVRMLALLEILLALGHRVTFLPDDRARVEPYASRLQQLGVELLYEPLAPVRYIQDHGHEFDIAILCRAPFAAHYLPFVLALDQRPFVIFDTVDLHYLREERLAVIQGDPVLAASAERTRGVETGAMRTADMVWVTSTHEAEIVRHDIAIPHVEIVPNIHEVRGEVPPFSSRRDILFVGGFRHAPNVDAVTYFVREIMPLVRRGLPGVHFLVVGSHTPQSIYDLASPDVLVMGHVRDLIPVVDGCRVTVAPLRYGAGVKGKVTQSMAWGVPSVATPVAAEGLRMVDGEHLLVAAGAEEFARRVIEVYQDEELWTRLSQNGRRHVETHLGQAAIRQSIGAMLERAVRGSTLEPGTSDVQRGS